MTKYKCAISDCVQHGDERCCMQCEDKLCNKDIDKGYCHHELYNKEKEPSECDFSEEL